MAKQTEKDTQQHYKEIVAELKSGDFKPYYVFTGEEPFYSDLLIDLISSIVLTEDEKSFNFHLYYGSDVNEAKIVELCRRYPMMASRQVVIIKEAQLIVSRGTDSKKDLLADYFLSPSETTLLVYSLTNKSLDKRGSLYKSAKNGKGVLFESKLLKDYEVEKWVDNYLKDKQFTSDPEALRMISEFCGNDLRKIDLELKKLISAADDSINHITAVDVEKNVGISREYNAFELGKALTEKRGEKVFNIIKHFGNNPKQFPLVLTLGSLYFHFSRVLNYLAIVRGGTKERTLIASKMQVNPYFIKDYELASKNFPLKKVIEVISLIRLYDSKSKSNDRGEATDSMLLTELASKILY